jgi:hypothetical protein
MPLYQLFYNHDEKYFKIINDEVLTSPGNMY